VPALGSNAAITGKVGGLPAGGNYQATLYVETATEAYYGPKATVNVGGDGSFQFNGWAQNGEAHITDCDSTVIGYIRLPGRS
jgi:hypothetical protein